MTLLLYGRKKDLISIQAVRLERTISMMVVIPKAVLRNFNKRFKGWTR